jgi:tRNA(Ile2)-agmatinylcytidine synthase
VTFSISAVRDIAVRSAPRLIYVVPHRLGEPGARWRFGAHTRRYDHISVGWHRHTLGFDDDLDAGDETGLTTDARRRVMPIVAVDDTDSREQGMCTTYVGVRLAERLTAAGGTVRRRLLVRLNPAVKHKTRGNAAVALHVADVDVDEAFTLAGETVREFAAVEDPRTAPGVVVADVPAGVVAASAAASKPPAIPSAVTAAIPEPVVRFARQAVHERLSLETAITLADRQGYPHAAFGTGGADGDEAPGRGRIGALAAIGAAAAFDDWTAAHISYRALDRCGTPRSVDAESVFTAANAAYPVVWDTVDREAGEVVCVPHAPGPILHGIRGDDPAACRRVAAAIESEPVERAATFHTNQGTDVHLRDGTIGDLADGTCYRVSGVVTGEPESRRGGHVHVDVAAASGATPVLRAVAFAPTGRFRGHVRALRPGDRVTLWRTMSSAGRDQGYRCRACATTAPGKVTVPLDRELERGWYEVPPTARRHVAKPLVRGGFDAPVHPER